MEMWLEPLAIHVAFGKDIPQDLADEILNFVGRSPPSSESTTPEVLTPENRRPPPMLRTISEGSHDFYSLESPPVSPTLLSTVAYEETEVETTPL